jgi:RNA polymerase primary sigma factor
VRAAVNGSERSAGLERSTHEQLISASVRARSLDREIAERLDRRGPTGRPASREYLERLDARPALTAEQERQLVMRAKRGDARARGELIEAFLPLVAATARNYRASAAVERLDLLQEGTVGLLQAIERFDPDRGVPFWGYASWWVRQSMQQLVAELTRPVVLSDRALRHLARLKDAYRRLIQTSGTEPPVAELARASGLSREQVENLLVVDRPPVSLDDRPDGDEELGALVELIEDPYAEQSYEEVLIRLEASELRALLSGLSDRERSVLAERHGVDGPQRSLRDIAGRLGVSAERVRQIEERALSKLRAGAHGGRAGADAA